MYLEGKMSEEITREQLDAAEAFYVGLKESGDAEELKNAAEALVELRSVYRNQEVEAGRRVGLVGGDASI